MKDDKELLQVGSLQNPVLSQTLAFEVAKRKEFVQILHQGVTIIGSQLQSLVLTGAHNEKQTGRGRSAKRPRSRLKFQIFPTVVELLNLDVHHACTRRRAILQLCFSP